VIGCEDCLRNDLYFVGWGIKLYSTIGILREQISQGKRFILSWKVRENEFCRVVGTMIKAICCCVLVHCSVLQRLQCADCQNTWCVHGLRGWDQRSTGYPRQSRWSGVGVNYSHQCICGQPVWIPSSTWYLVSWVRPLPSYLLHIYVLIYIIH